MIRSTTAQERRALAALAILVAGGIGARAYTEPEPVRWEETVDAVPPETAPGPEQEARLDPNRATARELERLPRIGPALAARIVEHREKIGAFRNLGDLDAVPGIGPALLDAVAPHVTLTSAPPASDTPLDVNRATAEDLVALPGIGPVMAQRIVDWRAANGRFRSVDDLLQVPGIGPKVLERVAPRLRV